MASYEEQQGAAIAVLTALLESDGGELARSQADDTLTDADAVRDLVHGLQGVALRLLFECSAHTGETPNAILQRLATTRLSE